MNTFIVRKEFRKRGFIPNAYQQVPDDHVALMCHFAALRAEAALVAYREGTREQVASVLRDSNAFAREHMANWLGRYARQLGYDKAAVIYPQVARALAAFVDADVERVDRVVWRLENDPEACGAPADFANADKAIYNLRSLHCEMELVTMA